MLPGRGKYESEQIVASDACWSSTASVSWAPDSSPGDFRLRLSTPEGEETWTFGPGVFGFGRRVRRQGLGFFEFQLRSWFEDHIPDLTERQLVPTRL